MKKFIIFILFLLIVNPAFAGNVLQQQDEVKFVQKVANKPLPNHYGKDYLIREDYYGYQNGKDSFYGDIVNTLNDINKSNIPNKEINMRYLKLLKTKIETIVKLANNNVDNNMRLNTVSAKIIIDDNDYKKLNSAVKEIIHFANFSMFN